MRVSRTHSEVRDVRSRAFRQPLVVVFDVCKVHALPSEGPVALCRVHRAPLAMRRFRLLTAVVVFPMKFSAPVHVGASSSLDFV